MADAITNGTAGVVWLTHLNSNMSVVWAKMDVNTNHPGNAGAASIIVDKFSNDNTVVIAGTVCCAERCRLPSHVLFRLCSHCSCCCCSLFSSTHPGPACDLLLVIGCYYVCNSDMAALTGSGTGASYDSVPNLGAQFAFLSRFVADSGAHCLFPDPCPDGMLLCIVALLGILHLHACNDSPNNTDQTDVMFSCADVVLQMHAYALRNAARGFVR